MFCGNSVTNCTEFNNARILVAGLLCDHHHSFTGFPIKMETTLNSDNSALKICMPVDY